MTVILIVTLQRGHDVVSDSLIVLPVITVNQPNGAVAKQELKKKTPISCEKSRMELQSLMRILSRIPTSSLVHKFACVYNRLTQGSNEKATNICLKVSCQAPIVAFCCHSFVCCWMLGQRCIIRSFY